MTLPTEHLFADTGENSSIALLKQHFPQCFDKDGLFLPDKLAEQLQTANVPVSREYYTMNWLGKSYARYLCDCPPITLLGEDSAHNTQSQNQHSQNLLIKGDNLEVLKHLKNAYANQVKMIYIDPPYNTGSDGFVYQDDRKFTPDELAKLADMSTDEARRVLDFTAKKSNSHSAWLTFMYPRLYIARELLKEDGVIFISIDDNEQAQLKLLCDEVFGEENFVANIIWQKKTGASDEDNVAIITEYILMYRKTDQFVAGKNNDSYDLNRYNQQDEYFEQRGNYYTDNLDRGGLQYSDSMNFGIKCPDGSLVFPNGRSQRVEEGWIWKWSKEKVKWGFENGFLEIKKSTRKECGWAVYYKNYLFVDNEGNPIERSAPYKNLIIDDVLNTDATLELKTLFKENKVFSSPKPSLLIEKLIALVKFDNDDVFLDFFAGSGTFAHGVMLSNISQKSNLKFICVQLPEDLDKALKEATGKQKSVVNNAIKFLDSINKEHNIFEITKERIIRSAQKIKSENPDYQGDLGFKIFETMPDFRATDDEISPQLEFPEMLHANLEPKQYETLLTTWCVYDGNALTQSVQSVELGGYSANLCGTTLYVVYPDFDSVAIKALLDKLDHDADFIIERIVLFGEMVESAKQRELKQALDTYNNKKNVHLSLLVRY
ncbi:site-specific DNA-methyltransferase [Moraxella catarrhalis]|uniref:site-specific DNA-methyltransferase (adenine-specific) n=1 Tax=Moraxella catarrhalis TaxID=480 RepID=A0AB36DQF1_MORCA|nr:DNA methyltransferase [Moraxella catarrhalis]MPX29299.1 type III restriction endonuclease subunit M [Moraxella catarrhalis]OAV11470.1 Type III restriction-modification system methylation subunit [Moraxella catarrhalis]OAV26798.1 Type III restriction-modification system methylation subunit [Moraxella catarrhalis]RKL85998.1 site-specific DNA-methyltransferase [Moraxella catarrhalis]RKL87963.1 site-specific DNA-methyltransferase [Moraxella catarrhalis]